MGAVTEPAWGSSSFIHWFNLHWFLQTEVVGTYFPGTGTLGLGTWCGPGTTHSLPITPEFLSTTYGCWTSLFYISTPPTSLDGCGFFNSVVSEFHSSCFLMVLSDGCSIFCCNFDVFIQRGELCLCHHLGWKSKIIFKYYKCRIRHAINY